MELETIPLRFRVWDKTYKKFIEDDDWSWRHLAIKPDGKIYEATAYTEYGGTQSECTSIEYEDISDDFIISQDTGLKDKNGKSIFTGDIIYSDRYDRCGEVVYRNGIISIKWRDTDPMSILGSIGAMSVKGNIWQNPELLEEKNETTQDN